MLDVCFDIHRQHGPGLFESVYEEILCYELDKRQVGFLRQHPLKVFHDGVEMNIGFRADLIVEDCLVLELKSVSKLEDVHYKQMLTYLKLTRNRLGLLINFNEVLLKNGIKRIINDL